MTKHTPGPWEAKRTPHSSNQSFVVLDGCRPHSKRICAVYSANEEADARLIAAAPDLLRALEELYVMVKGECPSLLNEDSGGCARLDIEIEDAITKARGQ